MQEARGSGRASKQGTPTPKLPNYQPHREEPDKLNSSPIFNPAGCSAPRPGKDQKAQQNHQSCQELSIMFAGVVLT